MLFIKILKKAPETLSRNEGCVLLPQTPPLLLPSNPPLLDGWWVELPHSDAASLRTLISRSPGLSDTINPFYTSTTGSHIQTHTACLAPLMSHSHAQGID